MLLLKAFRTARPALRAAQIKMIDAIAQLNLKFSASFLKGWRIASFANLNTIVVRESSQTV